MRLIPKTPVVILEGSDYAETYAAWCPHPELVTTWIESHDLVPAADLVDVVLRTVNAWAARNSLTPITAAETTLEMTSGVGGPYGGVYPKSLRDAKILALCEILPAVEDLDDQNAVITCRYTAHW